MQKLVNLTLISESCMEGQDLGIRAKRVLAAHARLSCLHTGFATVLHAYLHHKRAYLNVLHLLQGTRRIQLFNQIAGGVGLGRLLNHTIRYHGQAPFSGSASSLISRFDLLVSAMTEATATTKTLPRYSFHSLRGSTIHGNFESFPLVRLCRACVQELDAP